MADLCPGSAYLVIILAVLLKEVYWQQNTHYKAILQIWSSQRRIFSKELSESGFVPYSCTFMLFQNGESGLKLHAKRGSHVLALKLL